MADQHHLDSLKQGVAAWGQWRQERQVIMYDLSGANLTIVDLTGCFVSATSTCDITLTEAIQANLVITPPDEPSIIVDNLSESSRPVPS